MREIGGVAFYEESDDIEDLLETPDIICVLINGEKFYPACQFEDDETTVQGLRMLLSVLDEHYKESGQEMQAADLTHHLNWLFSPMESSITPLEWLRLGRDPAEVIAAARTHLRDGQF